jgi:hypothetical protein
MGQPNSTLVFALGCIGALSPEVVRLYKLRSRPWKKFSSYYYVISGVFAALGGVVAVVLPSVTVWAAFYAGVTWPTLISTITHHREPKIVEAANERRMRDNIVKATDHTREMEMYLPAKRNVKASRFGDFVELVRNHADGLFL